MQRRRRFCFRIVGSLSALAVIFAVIVTALVKFYVGPAILRSRSIETIGRFWSGPVMMEDVDFRFDGRMELQGLVLSDEEDRQWVSMPNVKVNVEDYRRADVRVTELDVGRLDFTLRVPDRLDEFPLGLRDRFKSQDSLKERHLERLIVRGGSVKAVSNSAQHEVCDNLSFSLVGNDKIYEISATAAATNGSGTSSLSGSMDKRSWQGKVRWLARYDVGREEGAVLVKWLGVPAITGLDGKFRADVQSDGPLNQPFSMRHDGTLDFSDCVLYRNGFVCAEKIIGEAKFAGAHTDIEDVNFKTFGGQGSGFFYVDFNSPESIQYGGKCQGAGIGVSEFAATFGVKDKVAGTASFEFDFRAATNGIQSLDGTGIVFLEDADLRIVPLLTRICQTLGLKQTDPLRMSDATLVFRMNGDTATIERGRIANRIVAIRTEPGGTVNLKTGQVDFYVIAAPLSQIEEIIRKVPVAGLFVDLKDKLVRLRVKGHWSDSAGKLISKQPLTDITEATVDFFKGLVETGGQLTEQMRKTSRSLLKGTKSNKKAQ